MNLTNREKEILAYLKDHPMISQDDLANHFSITRSSVAVHVSNLMKKGAVLGKGYIFDKDHDLTVEIVGRYCLQEIRQNEDSGESELSLLFGFAYKIKELLHRFGVNIMITSVNEPSPFNLSSATENKDDKWLKWNDYCLVPEDYFNQQDYYEIIEANNEPQRWLIIEPDLPQAIIHNWLKEPQNDSKICSGFFLNNENELSEYLYSWSLLVIGVPRETDLDGIMERVLQSEARAVIVSDGEERLYYLHGQKFIEFILAPKQRFDPRQDMPYFLGGVVFGLASGYSLRQAIRIALSRTLQVIQK